MCRPFIHLATHARISSTHPITPRVVTDGLQSFYLSQYFPDYINILVNSDSQFLHEMNFNILRRGGRMTDEQKRRGVESESKWKADPKAVQWAKNSNDMMARLAIYQVFHNNIKPYRIRREAGDRRTHGTEYGFDGRMIARELKGLFTDRAFRTRLELSGDQTRTWLRL